MTKEELALEIIRRLKKEYPDAGCTLDYNEAWKLLVSVRLAAQCTDAESMWSCRISMRNTRRGRCPGRGRPEEIEAIVRPCGLGKSKARTSAPVMRMAAGEYGGKVPVILMPS